MTILRSWISHKIFRKSGPRCYCQSIVAFKFCKNWTLWITNFGEMLEVSHR